eukprot:257242-Pelagomonas_calceolata.AAC.2
MAKKRLPKMASVIAEVSDVRGHTRSSSHLMARTYVSTHLKKMDFLGVEDDVTEPHAPVLVCIFVKKGEEGIVMFGRHACAGNQ